MGPGVIQVDNEGEAGNDDEGAGGDGEEEEDSDDNDDDEFDCAEGLANEEAEVQALGDILESAVAAVGEEAVDFAAAIDDAPGAVEVQMALGECIRDRRNRKPVNKMNL